MKIAKLIPCGVKQFVISVNSYNEGILSGQVFHPRLKASVEFHSFIQLVILMDDLLSMDDCPLPNDLPLKGVELQKSAISNFTIEVLFQQNSSWQGKVVWLEQQTEANFRSVLELMCIIDTVLSE